MLPQSVIKKILNRTYKRNRKGKLKNKDGCECTICGKPSNEVVFRVDVMLQRCTDNPAWNPGWAYVIAWICEDCHENAPIKKLVSFQW